jgi:hypothetical protein
MPVVARSAGPADIPVGRLAVVADVFGNELVLLDLSEGTYRRARADLAISGPDRPGVLRLSHRHWARPPLH